MHLEAKQMEGCASASGTKGGREGRTQESRKHRPIGGVQDLRHGSELGGGVWCCSLFFRGLGQVDSGGRIGFDACRCLPFFLGRCGHAASVSRAQDKDPLESRKKKSANNLAKQNKNQPQGVQGGPGSGTSVCFVLVVFSSLLQHCMFPFQACVQELLCSSALV